MSGVRAQATRGWYARRHGSREPAARATCNANTSAPRHCVVKFYFSNVGAFAMHALSGTLCVLWESTSDHGIRSGASGCGPWQEAPMGMTAMVRSVPSWLAEQQSNVPVVLET